MAAFDVGAHEIGDPSEAQADHIPVKKLSIGSWNLLAKYDEHVLLSFYWAEHKLVWEVLHLGVVRKMEVDFEDVSQMDLAQGTEEQAPDRVVITLHRPPRFFKENPPTTVSGGAQEVSYVYTTDFTNGQASTESRHLLLFEQGAITREHIKMVHSSGMRLVVEGFAGDPRGAQPTRRLLRRCTHAHAHAHAPLASRRVQALPAGQGGCCARRAACMRRARTFGSHRRARRASTPFCCRTS
jgi:hypothetical protein